MFFKRHIFKATAAALVLLIATSLAFNPPPTTVVQAQVAIRALEKTPKPEAIRALEKTSKPEADHQALDIQIKPQRLFAPHWTTEESFSTTIYLRNVHISQALTARVSLILKKHVIALSAIRLKSQQTVAIDVANALRENGEEEKQSGGAVVDFKAESAGALSVYAHVLDTTRSLGFSFKFLENTVNTSGPLDAVALMYNPRTAAFVALQNTSAEATKATLAIYLSGRRRLLGSWHLQPNRVTVLKLPVAEAVTDGDAPYSAGIRVEHDGKPGTVVAQGWIMDESIGFSAPFVFHPPSTCDCEGDVQHKYGAGIMIAAGGMGQMPSAPDFSPLLAARNRSDAKMTVTPVFSYESEDGVEQARLSEMTLGPQDSAIINLRAFQEQGLIPATVQMGDIDLQYRGAAGALVAELASVDRDGSFVSPVPLTCNGGQAMAMTYWRTDGDWHSSMTLQNIAAEATNVEITISYPGGLYLLDKQIPAGHSAMISINDLQQSQEPDREGRRIPKDATLGGVNIWSPDIRNGLVINAMLMNPVTKTCGQCYDPGYVTQYTVSDKQASSITPLYSGFDPHPAGQGFSIWLNVHYSMGSQGGVTPNYSSSSNQSVATATQGYGSTVTAGTADITARGDNFFTDIACSQLHSITTTSSLTVVPNLTVNEVGFTGDYQITRFADGVVIDNPDGNAPTWKSSSNPDYPVAYTKGAVPTMFAKFGVSPTMSTSMTGKIRVKNGSTTIAIKGSVTVTGNSITVTGITMNATLESKAKKATPTFTWEMTFDGGSHWHALGSSGPHTMYWTQAAPLSPAFKNDAGTTYAALYDLALEKACSYANAPADVSTLITRVNQGIDADINYEPSTSIGTQNPLNAYSVQGGCQCSDLANLLRGELRSIGVDGTTMYIWAGPNASTIRTYTQFSTGYTISFRIIRAAHDSAGQDPHFLFHSVVSTNGTWYDPSYGLSYSSLTFGSETGYTYPPQQVSTSTWAPPPSSSGFTCSH